jgi:hypothetical protein
MNNAVHCSLPASSAAADSSSSSSSDDSRMTAAALLVEKCAIQPAADREAFLPTKQDLLTVFDKCPAHSAEERAAQITALREYRYVLTHIYN